MIKASQAIDELFGRPYAEIFSCLGNGVDWLEQWPVLNPRTLTVVAVTDGKKAWEAGQRGSATNLGENDLVWIDVTGNTIAKAEWSAIADAAVFAWDWESMSNTDTLPERTTTEQTVETLPTGVATVQPDSTTLYAQQLWKTHLSAKNDGNGPVAFAYLNTYTALVTRGEKAARKVFNASGIGKPGADELSARTIWKAHQSAKKAGNAAEAATHLKAYGASVLGGEKEARKIYKRALKNTTNSADATKREGKSGRNKNA